MPNWRGKLNGTTSELNTLHSILFVDVKWLIFSAGCILIGTCIILLLLYDAFDKFVLCAVFVYTQSTHANKIYNFEVFINAPYRWKSVK